VRAVALRRTLSHVSWKFSVLSLPVVVGGLAAYDLQAAAAAGFVLVLLLFVAAVFRNTDG